MTQSPYLVDIQWLKQQLNDPGVVVIDTRFSLADPELGRRQYQSGHIPGAYYLDLDQDLSSSVRSHGGRHPLPDWEIFVTRLNQMGIKSDPPTQIVIYDDSRFAFAARLWWMLRYLGHQDVAILDGGIRAWLAAGFGVETEDPGDRAGDFSPTLHPDWTVSVETVRQRQEKTGLVLIDSRSPERFRGEVEPIDPIAGSIPGAVNAFWQQVTTADGYLHSADKLSEYWARIINPGDQVIVYCGSGVTACVNLFSLAVIGYPMHQLYPGGWSDWCSYTA